MEVLKMGLEGNFKQIGHDTLKEIYSSLKNDSKIDKNELEKIKKSVMSDGNKTKGETELLNKIEDCLNKKLEVKASNFEPKNKLMNFDLKINNKNVLVVNSQEENFKEKISIEKICAFLDKNFDKLKNKDGRIDLLSLEEALRKPSFTLDDKKIIDRLPNNLNIFLDKDIKSFSDITFPPFGISKDDITRVKQISKISVSEKIKNQIANLENNTFRSQEHLKIIDAASRTDISKDVKEWSFTDSVKYAIKNKASMPLNKDYNLSIDPSQGEDFINSFKDNYIKSHKDIIKKASKMYDIPENLLAGILHKEVGGLPYESDNLSYFGRKHLPDNVKNVLKNLPGISNLSRDKQLTSFGNISIQIRRAKESLNYSYNISDKQEKEIINSLVNSKESIFICAKHIKDLKNIDFKNKPFSKLSKYELAIVATRYNVGPGDTKERQAGKGFGYGQSIIDNFKNLYYLLK